jgi:hypothetical protein
MGLLSGISKAAGGLIGDLTGAGDIKSANRASSKLMRETADTESANVLSAGRSAQDLIQSGFSQAQGYLNPYLESSGRALGQLDVEMGLAPGQAGTAYMQSPAYQAMQDERQAGVSQAAAGAGNLYSGRRLESAGDVSETTQQSFYNNYMNMLSGMASPNTASNLANMGMSSAGSQANMGYGSQATASDIMMQGAGAQGGYNVAGASAQQAGIADLLGGGANVLSGAFAGGYI